LGFTWLGRRQEIGVFGIKSSGVEEFAIKEEEVYFRGPQSTWLWVA